MKLLSPRFRFGLAAINAVVVVFVTQSPARAQEDNRPPKGFVALFNGHDFDNWIGGLGEDLRKVAAMSPEKRAERQKNLNDGIHQHWRIEDGVLITDGNE